MVGHDAEGPGPAITPRTRARARHILDHYFIGPARDDDILEIWGYTPQMSYAPGDTVSLHVSTTAPRWSLEIGRDGAEYVSLLSAEDLPGVHHDTPQDCSVNGCNWPSSFTFVVPQDWRPGGYLITLRASRDDDLVEEHHLILIREPLSSPAAPYVLVCATGTWLAYNCWGGSNHYEGIVGEDGTAFSPVVSTQRPWSRGFCRLPAGAPRALPDVPPRPGEMVRYPYMEWAYAYGFSKKYASAGWASYERHFAVWAEQQGYRLDFITQHDLEREPDILDRYRCAVFVGHDEYWTATMRDRVDQFVDKGGRAARFAGNFLWQTRLEDDGTKQICYKYDALSTDPFMHSDRQHLVTGAWGTDPVGRPGASTFGVNGLSGIYAGLGNCAGRGAGGYTIYRPDHWALSGTGLGYGDILGAEARIFGYEVDGLDFRFDDGLPYPTGKDGAAQDILILAMGLATNLEVDNDVWGETLYIGKSDAEFKARALFGEVTEESLDSAVRGNGVMICWKRGKGEVFSAATCEWVNGLTKHDTQIERITRNVLDRYGRA